MNQMISKPKYINNIIFKLYTPSFLPPDKEADKEATEMLTNNAQNLMKVVSEVLYATEAASIRVPTESRANLPGLTWVKRWELLSSSISNNKTSFLYISSSWF